MARRFHRFASLMFLSLSAVFISSCTSSNFPVIAVQVDPLCVALVPGESQQFNATIFIDEVDQGIDNTAVTWSVLGGDVNGVIDQTGFYQSPDTIPPPAAEVTIIATSKEDEQKVGQATAVLTGECPVVPPFTQ